MVFMDLQNHMFEQTAQGSGEWKAVQAVRGDHVNAYRVAQPKKHIVPRIVRFGTGRLLILKGAG